MNKNKKYFEYLQLSNDHSHIRSAGSMKTARLAMIACASLLIFNSPPALAQEKAKSKANVTAEDKKAADTKALGDKKAPGDKKAVARVHAEALELARVGEYAKAVEMLEPYAKQPLLNVPITGDYLVFIIWSGDNLKATKEFEKLPATFPKSTYVMRNMAKAYYDQNNFEPSASLYAETLKKVPADEEAQKGHVLSLYHGGKAGEAAAKLNEYLKAYPDSATLQYLKPQILQ